MIKALCSSLVSPLIYRRVVMNDEFGEVSMDLLNKVLLFGSSLKRLSTIDYV